MEHREVCNHIPADTYGDTFCLKCDADGVVTADGRFEELVSALHFHPEARRRSDEIEALKERNAVLAEEHEKIEELRNTINVERHKNDLRINTLNQELKIGV